MARRSKKSIAEILATSASSSPTVDNIQLQKKIASAIEGFTTKFCELFLRDRNRISEENALTICDYIIAMKREINPRLSVHYFGNESSIDILEAYGIVTKDNVPIDTLNPKMCPNCNEGNTSDARFCSKCKMIMSFDGYQEVLQEQQDKDKDLQSVKE
jgi:hypothetical protein